MVVLLWSLEKGHLDFSHHFQLSISSKANSRVSFEHVNRKSAAQEGRRGHLKIFPVLLKWHQCPCEGTSSIRNSWWLRSWTCQVGPIPSIPTTCICRWLSKQYSGSQDGGVLKQMFSFSPNHPIKVQRSEMDQICKLCYSAFSLLWQKSCKLGDL